MMLPKFWNHQEDHTISNIVLKMVQNGLSSRIYGHLNIPYNLRQLNDDRSTLSSEDARCKLFPSTT